jgi:YD repeat-containing protein
VLVTITDPIGRTYDHAYDGAGNRTSLNQPNGTATTYTRDDLNRLTSASHVQLVRGFTGLLQWIRLFFGRAL